MDPLRRKLGASPLLPRVLPFFIFLGLTFCQGKWGAASACWFYALKTAVGAWSLWVVWPLVEEMRWKISLEAVVVGVAVFALWVGLDGCYPTLDKFVSKKEAAPFLWNPHAVFGQGTTLAWFFILVRLVGSILVVPPLEEVFYRSFLYRYLAKQDFQTVALKTFLPVPFFATALIFGGNHNEWLPGILCGLAYQGLVVWKGRLGDAMTAHAITNFLLGIWVVGRGAWHFW